MPNSDTALATLLQSAYRYAHALCAHAEMAEDLVHESWLKLLAKHGTKPDRALLFRVIRNLFIDSVRHSARFPSDSFEEHVVSDQAGFDPSQFASHDLVLAQALTELRSVDREVLFLWVFEGYTAAEIAELTEQSRNTVLSQIHRSKGKLRKHLEQYSNQQMTVVKSTENLSS